MTAQNKKKLLAITMPVFLLMGVLMTACGIIEEISTIPASPTFTFSEDNQNWDGYIEPSADWNIDYVAYAGSDGNTMQCSLIGSDEPYGNLHCYLNYEESEPKANKFTYALSFLYTPETTYNNQEGHSSIVQALEFSMNKWYQKTRSLQWQNVGNGAPQWRYWNPHAEEKWVAIEPKIEDRLEANTWHRLTIEGEIDAANQIIYKGFTINETYHSLEHIEPIQPWPDQGQDRLAIAVQLDGNSVTSPYTMYVDQVSFTYE